MKEAVRASVGATVALYGAYAPMLLDRNDLPGTPDTPTFALFGLALQEREADFTTDALFANIARHSNVRTGAGSWWASLARREENHFGPHSAGGSSLTRYAPPARKAEMERRRVAASRLVDPRQTAHHRRLRLAAAWSGLGGRFRARSVPRQHASCATLQRADGGRREQGDGERRLHNRVGFVGAARSRRDGAGRSDLPRSVRYLLRTQRAGRHVVRGESGGEFQPYFESGFHYGPDQWVSISATAWAGGGAGPGG
ncbi:MAG: hypothetical protein R2724_07325 [Bryobacterales bacterium]